MVEKITALVVTLLTVFVFFVGWTYLYNYYYYLGVDISEINPSLQYTLIYALPALVHLISPRGELYPLLWMLTFAAMVVAGLYYFVHHHIRHTPNWPLEYAAIALAIGIAAVEGYNASESLARDTAIKKWMSDSNPAYVELKDANDKADPCATSQPNVFAGKFACLNRQLRLRLIISTDKFHYLFARDNCDRRIYSMCPGLLFKIATGDSKLTILHPAEEKHE